MDKMDKLDMPTKGSDKMKFAKKRERLMEEDSKLDEAERVYPTKEKLCDFAK